MSQNDEFYIGYLESTPPGIKRHTRSVVAALLLLSVALAVLFAFLQEDFDPGIFAFGEVSQLEGTLRTSPYPMIVDDSERSAVLLVEQFKHSAAARLAELDGTSLRLSGTTIERDDDRMFELTPDEPESLGPGAASTPTLDLGRHELVGEIVDSKCFLGVMKPGRGKPHRACAALCLAGGIPPAFYVQTTTGDSVTLLLTDTRGEAVTWELDDWIGEPLRATGQVVQRNGWLELRVARDGLSRL